MATHWIGKAPENCDICNSKILVHFVDGKTKMGPWANMCTVCHVSHGCGLGTGKGQLYQKNGNDWVKVDG